MSTKKTEGTAQLTGRGTARNRMKLVEPDDGDWLEDDDPLTDAEKALLNARLAAYANDPGAGSSWEEVESRIRSRIHGVSANLLSIQH